MAMSPILKSKSKRKVSLSVGRGEKLPVSKGAGLTAGPGQVQQGDRLQPEGAATRRRSPQAVLLREEPQLEG